MRKLQIVDENHYTYPMEDTSLCRHEEGVRGFIKFTENKVITGYKGNSIETDGETKVETELQQNSRMIFYRDSIVSIILKQHTLDRVFAVYCHFTSDEYFYICFRYRLDAVLMQKRIEQWKDEQYKHKI